MESIQNFTMDDNLLVSVIKSQAGTLSKALLEGVMNSIDAAATRVDVTITAEGFKIEDNGRGFNDLKEVTQWFGRFGTPHSEGDSTYGRFRMGRGQMMAFARCAWRSGTFEMSADIQAGLKYKLTENLDNQKGCTVQGTLFKPMESWTLADTIAELKKFVAYTPRPVYVNGVLAGDSPQRLKTWTDEDEYAFYKIVPGASEMQIYNQGVFVEEKPSWRIGSGGLVVSKKPLEVNFARNAVMERSCPHWRQVAHKLEQVIFQRLARAEKLTQDERCYLARNIKLVAGSRNVPNWRSLKLITDPSGKHMSFDDLAKFRNIVVIRDDQALACAVHGTERTLVLDDNALQRFSIFDAYEFTDLVNELDSTLLANGLRVIDVGTVRKYGLGSAKSLDSSGLKPKQTAELETLKWLNHEVAARLHLPVRELRLGEHKLNAFVAWTDGKSYITVNKRYLNKLESGFDGALYWIHTLIHEYTHDSDDSESHSHGEVFFRQFHDHLFSDFGNEMGLGFCAQSTVARLLAEFEKAGLAKPHSLTRQIKGQNVKLLLGAT